MPVPELDSSLDPSRPAEQPAITPTAQSAPHTIPIRSIIALALPCPHSQADPPNLPWQRGLAKRRVDRSVLSPTITLIPQPLLGVVGRPTSARDTTDAKFRKPASGGSRLSARRHGARLRRRARVAPACIEHLGGRRLMGAVGCRGAFGVTLQFALALRTRGFCATVRELNLARRRRRAPWLLGTASEIRLRTGRRDRSDHRPQVTSDELRADAKSAVARTCELAISARVSARPKLVIAAIDLDDQAG